jgi:hypothetical protein
MKKLFLKILLFSIFVSCDKKEKDLDLILLNNEVVCVENIDMNVSKINEKDYINNKAYDSLSRNVLNYKLTNNSTNKYFIVLNSNSLEVMESNFILEKLVENRIGTKSGLSFNLYKNNSIIKGRTTLTSGGADYQTETEYYKSPLYKRNVLDSIFIKNAENKKLYKTDYPSVLNRETLENSFVIYPGEIKYFTSIVNLPLRKEGVNWISNINELKPNLASFSLVNIAEYTKNSISENQKKEIEENGYTIFDGIIQSNKIPVKMVNMPEEKE